MKNQNNNFNSSDSYSDFDGQLKGQTYTGVENKKKFEIPHFDDYETDSSDSDPKPPSQPRSLTPTKPEDTKKNQKNTANTEVEKKVDDNNNESLDDERYDDIFSTNFSTSKIETDFGKIDKEIGKISSSSEDEETNNRLRYQRRQNPPAKSYATRSVVASMLDTSSEDDDGQFKPAPKPKPHQKIQSKKIQFEKNDNYYYTDHKNPLLKDDGMSTKSSSRPKARSIAGTTIPVKKWTPSVAKESHLDVELRTLIERESRLDEIASVKSAKMGKTPNNGNMEFNNGDENNNDGDSEEITKLSLQAAAEKHYSRMLKKKCPNLVRKKTEINNRQNHNFLVDFNNDILHWSREMIADENERIKEKLADVLKELNDIRQNNKEMQNKIDSVYQENEIEQ